jgi:hydroxymethylbilane synthase
MRGNVDTRLRKLADGDYDAIVLALAGLRRLGRDEGTPLPFVPAPGQGCLALEARADDPQTGELAASITHRQSLARLTAERAVCAALDATCHTPIGVLAELRGEELELTAWVGLPDGSRWISDTLIGDAEQPGALGGAVGERMLAVGAGDLLAEAEAQLTT